MADCFIIMPVSTPAEMVERYGRDPEHFRHVLDHLFVPAVKSAGLNPIPPVSRGAEIIHADIIRRLELSEMLLCDMSALNANVFFELGIRTALDKPAALVKDTLVAKTPFDTTLINNHTYDPSLAPWTLTAEIEKLANHLRDTFNHGDRNSLWKYFGLSSRAELPEASSTEEKLDYILHILDQSRHSGAITIEDIADDDPLRWPKLMLRAAQSIAAMVSAEFNVLEIATRRLSLDASDYVIGIPERRMITELGAIYGIKVTIQGGYEDISQVPKDDA